MQGVLITAYKDPANLLELLEYFGSDLPFIFISTSERPRPGVYKEFYKLWPTTLRFGISQHATLLTGEAFNICLPFSSLHQKLLKRQASATFT